MIDGRQLLADLQPLRRRLEDDLRERSDAVLELGQRLKDEWRAARERERTAQTYEAWREDALAQAAVMWLVACVFVRFLEDNELVEPPRIAGPGAKLSLARDQRTMYFQAHPHASDRDYLYSVFEAIAGLPAAAPLFDHRHNPIWNIGISGDAATEVIEFWQRVVPETGTLVHDFTDPDWQTRFLGDLYQDLSESARKKYALLQTPDFVLQFILDRTLTPAIAEFGFRDVRLIDPACGSGHFLLAAFDRLFRLWSHNEPGTNPRQLAQRALAQVAGVDLNPLAVAIARFRLLLAALRASNITGLIDAPAFEMELAAGDSLLHGPRPGEIASHQPRLDPADDPLAHVYATEDAEDLKRILGRRYHVVVGNPPYITPKDAALNKAYRERFGSCHMKYSLGVPFTERLFDLAVEPEPGDASPAGYVGMITANSFMKREFGKKLIEEFIPKWDLTHVIDTSGANPAGHGTPTVILFGRHRSPASSDVRAVLGIKGDPPTTDDPAEGPVWRAIVDQTDRPGSSSEFVSVSDTARETFEKHPWSIGGGGTAELKQRLEETASEVLDSRVDSIGFASFPGTDDAFLAPATALKRAGVPRQYSRLFILGETVRDWTVSTELSAFVPYGDDFEPISYEPAARWARRLWPLRTTIGSTISFGGRTRLQNGDRWWTWYRWIPAKYRQALSIVFASVATHNHFVLDRGGKAFKQSAPVIKLPADATEEDHLALLGLLNSSTGCFWLKQVCHSKGAQGINEGAKAEMWERFIDVSAAAVADFPLAASAPRELARALDSATMGCHPSSLAEDLMSAQSHGTPKAAWLRCLAQCVGLQEELDWQVYKLYGILPSSPLWPHADPPPINLGQRAFEIVMARRMAAGELETAWFQRHGSTPITEVPTHWPEAYREVVQRRIELIESNPEIALIEQPEYKRRWNVDPWEEQVERSLREWLLDRLESPRYWPSVAITSVAHLSDLARQDQEFIRAAALYRGQDDFDVSALVGELVEAAAVPFLPVLRYKESGLRKREQWERTWDLQRREDAGENVGEIPVPPKYASADFEDGVFWQLRGKLDVPKERFISYPFCQRDADPTPVIAWAGWDHLQQAKALATYYVRMKESEGWNRERLTPLLAGLLELLSWLVHWHNEIDSEYGQRMGDYFDGFVDEEARALGLTREAIRAWTPPAGPARRRTRRTQPMDE